VKEELCAQGRLISELEETGKRQPGEEEGS
jgi:hypothetical protein